MHCMHLCTCSRGLAWTVFQEASPALCTLQSKPGFPTFLGEGPSVTFWLWPLRLPCHTWGCPLLLSPHQSITELGPVLMTLSSFLFSSLCPC